MTVEDVCMQNRRIRVRLREKGGKRHAMPCHHNLEEYLVAYLDGAGLRGDPKGLLFRNDRDWGTPHRATPPTLPGIRVAYHGGSIGLSVVGNVKSGETERVEVVVAQGLLDRQVSAAYRARWKLPPDHPVTARRYSEQRSAMAKQRGLGRQPAPDAAASSAATPRRRPRRPIGS
jgi:hypothetical protein